ncbi:MAG: hypothetical protein KC422_25495 [Trueperaceae bacterium]|nr:hypothetical protein [Trueperaceae bacterium]
MNTFLARPADIASIYLDSFLEFTTAINQREAIRSDFDLDNLAGIARLLVRDIEPGASMAIAGSVLKALWQGPINPGQNYGDILLNQLPESSSHWSYSYNQAADYYQFRRLKTKQ